jgi:predicted MFS family arabinose efflux permease
VGARRSLLLLVCGILFVDTTFYAAISPLLPYFADRLDLSKAAAGLLTGAYPAGALLGALPGGWLAARAGVKPTVLLGMGMLAGSSLAFGFADSAPLLDAARFVQGLGGAASWAGAMAWIVQRTPAERRGEVIGTVFGAALAGALAGPILGALARGVGTKPAFAAIAGLALVLAAWAWRESAPATTRKATRGLAAALRDPGVLAGMEAIVMVGLFFGVVEVLLPLRLDQLGAGAAVIGGTFVAAAGIEGLTGRFMGRIADRRGPTVPVRVALVAAVVFAVLIPLPTTVWLLVALIVLAAVIVGGGLWVPGMALLSKGAERAGSDQGYAFALMNLAWAAAQMTGATAGGAVAEAAGDGVAYGGLAALCAAGLVIFSRPQARAARFSA